MELTTFFLARTRRERVWTGRRRTLAKAAADMSGLEACARSVTASVRAADGAADRFRLPVAEPDGS